MWHSSFSGTCWSNLLVFLVTVNSAMSIPVRLSQIVLLLTLQWLQWPGHQQVLFNSLAPGRFERNFRHVIFKQISVIDGWRICCEIALIWMSLDFIDDQSTLVQVMAWCRQATSHYMSQCWPRSMSPFGVNRPQWVNACLIALLCDKYHILCI